MYYVRLAKPAHSIQRSFFFVALVIATCVHYSPQHCWGFEAVSIKDLKEKKEILQSHKQEQLTSRNTLLQAQRNLQTASANVDAILGIEEAKVREVPQIKQSSRNTDPSL